MTELGMTQRHGRLLTVLSLLLGLTACGSLPDEVTDVNGVPCMTFRKTHAPKRICAANPAPSAEVAREIKTFAPDPASAQVLVKLLDRAGATRALSLRVNGQAVADLVPGGLVRLRLSPGEHELAVAWGNQQATLSVQVRAGDVQFAEVGAGSGSGTSGSAGTRRTPRVLESVQRARGSRPMSTCGPSPPTSVVA